MESLTLIAGAFNLPLWNVLYRWWTPIMVSSDKPRISVKYWEYFSWMSDVRSPPSFRIMFRGCFPRNAVGICSMHHKYSSSISPFHVKMGMPVAAIVAAAWSWVEKMLQDDHETCNPRATRVSIRMAVCIVIWRQPAIRAPLSGCDGPHFAHIYMRPGFSFSVICISLQLKAASEVSATL